MDANFGIICTAKKQKLACNEACEKGNKDEDIAKKCGNGEKSLQRYDEGCYIGRLKRKSFCGLWVHFIFNTLVRHKKRRRFKDAWKRSL